MKFFNNTKLEKLDEKNWEYYSNTLLNDNKEVWDYIIITATNKKQELIYKEQIEIRKEKQRLPLKTKFMVITDYNEKRIGSGGSTLNILKEIYTRKIDYKNKKILIIHSGGEGKRIFQYSNQGKIFMPIQRVLPDGRESTLFDEILISFAIMPSKIDNGIVISSGDVWLMMDYSNIDLKKEKLIAISVKAESKKGINHGVFLTDSNNNLEKFLHKQSIEILKKYQAIEDNQVDVDTGVIYFGRELVNKLLELITTKGKFDKEKFKKFVDEKIQLSIYNDFTYVFSKKSNLEEYLKEKSEGVLCDELIKCRKEIWEKLKMYNLKILKNDISKFIHLGTNYELITMLKSKEFNTYKSISSNIRSKYKLQCK